MAPLSCSKRSSCSCFTTAPQSSTKQLPMGGIYIAQFVVPQRRPQNCMALHRYIKMVPIKLSLHQLRDAVSRLMPGKLISFGDHCLWAESYVDSMPWDFGWTALLAMVSRFLSHRTTLTYLCCICLGSCIVRHAMRYIWWVFTTWRVQFHCCICHDVFTDSLFSCLS